MQLLKLSKTSTYHIWCLHGLEKDYLTKHHVLSKFNCHQKKTYEDCFLGTFASFHLEWIVQECVRQLWNWSWSMEIDEEKEDFED